LGSLVFALHVLGSLSDPLYRGKQGLQIHPHTKVVSGTVSSEAASTSVTLLLDEEESKATITLSGPSGVWFGVGFDAPNFVMADNPYAIIVDGSGEVSETKLDTPLTGHGPGTLLEPSVEVLSTIDEDGYITVVIRRSLTGASSDHYTFDMAKSSLPLIIASGTTAEFGYHGAYTRSGETLDLALNHFIEEKESTMVSGSITSAEASITLTLELDDSTSTAMITLKGPSGAWFSVGFGTPNFNMADTPYAIVVTGNGDVTERKLANHGKGSLLEPSIELLSQSDEAGFTTVVLQRALIGTSADHYTFDATATSLPLIFASGSGALFIHHPRDQRASGTIQLISKKHNSVRAKVSGSLRSSESFTTVSLELDDSTSTAMITLKGPTGVWFGVGFDAPNFVMADTPYTIVVGGDGSVTERVLALHAPGNLLEPSVEVISSSSEMGYTTVTMQRALVGNSHHHYTFDTSKMSIPLLFASGNGADFSRHPVGQRSGGSLELVPGAMKKAKKTVSGSLESEAAYATVALELDDLESMATITIKGPSGKWVGVAFDAPNFLMADEPYVIVVEGSGEVIEATLTVHGPGIRLEPSVEIISRSDQDGFTTVVLRRALIGQSEKHYTFDMAKTSLPLLMASGEEASFGYHGLDKKSGGTIELVR